jgi:hypothetical protein
MSVVTNPQAVPSRLYAIYAALYDSENGQVKDRIEGWATPPSLNTRGGDEDGAPTTTLFSNTLLEAKKLGLVEEVEGKLRLTSTARDGMKKGQGSEAQFLAVMRQVLFDSLKAAETDQTQFMFALTWFLSANPLRPSNFADPPQNDIRAQIGAGLEKTGLTSTHHVQTFYYWARYLGFATIIGGASDTDDQSSRRVFPDPIKAIESALPAIFSQTKDLPIDEFLIRLAAIFPVFEMGAIRQKYDDMRLTPLAEANQRLSVSTSLALQRLNDRQVLNLSSVSDASSRILDLGNRAERISRVSLRAAT